MRVKSVLLVAFAGSLTVLNGANILKNGDIVEKDASGFAAHWQIWPKKLSDKVSIRLDNTNSKTGGQSVVIYHKDEHRYSRIDQLNVPCKPHTKYVARFWAKGQNIQTTQKGGVRMFIGPNGGLNRPMIQFGPGLEMLKKNIPMPWTFGWNLYESNVFGSGNNKELGVTVYFRNASGTVWLDDIEIVEYTPDVERNRKAEHARKLIRQDIEQVKSIAPELEKELSKVAADAEKFMPSLRDPRQGMPFFAPQRELGRIFGKYLQNKFKTCDIIVSQVCDPLKLQSAYIIPGKAVPETITVDGLKNEVEAFALNITNPSDTAQQIKITVPENLELSVYTVIHVETDRRTVVDDAMLPLTFECNNTTTIKIPAGMTRQIYFKTALKYAKSGTITINGKSIKIDYRPKATVYPQDLDFTLFSYAYPYRFGFIEKHDQARKLRFDMHNNGAMPYQFCSPLPYFDKKGKFTASKVNWGKLDTILAMTPKPHKLVIPMPIHTVNHVKESLGTDKGVVIKVFSVEWERRLGIWLKNLTAGLKKRGIDYKDFSLVLIDEPTDDRIEYIRKTSAVIKKFDKNLRIYNNFNYGISANRIAEFVSALDIIAPEISEMTPDKLKVLKSSGKEIWVYHVQNRCYPADKMRDNFVFFRQENVKGFSYWCFYDSHPRWQPTGGQSYAIFYDAHDGSWQPSKRSEGIREGVELYALLTVLKEQSPEKYQEIMKNVDKTSGTKLRREVMKFIK
ncbi:MAG: hypothetical protein E7039_07625 [Lentisphaerae bacterium]|nr:hypothetical protein [Lentisphaerota bacterium]